MRFMCLVKSAKMTPPTQALMEAMEKLTEQETKAGRLIETGGLTPTTTEVGIKAGKIVVTDGPFPETKEIIGGYAIMELPGYEEAVASAVEFMNLHLEHMPGWEGTCEVRQFMTEPPCVA